MRGLLLFLHARALPPIRLVVLRAQAAGFLRTRAPFGSAGSTVCFHALGRADLVEAASEGFFDPRDRLLAYVLAMVRLEFLDRPHAQAGHVREIALAPLPREAFLAHGHRQVLRQHEGMRSVAADRNEM